MEISDELRKLVDPNNECCCEHCLSNKGKQWANNKGFRIIEIDTDLFWVIPKKYNISYSFSYGMVLSKHNTFFKACQWILDNKKEGN